MNWDISKMLEGWPLDEETPRARWVVLPDGRRQIQLRVDLGVLQMNLDGRPDGQRPFGFESILAHYRNEEAKGEGGELPYALDNLMCDELRMEFLQYQARMEALFNIGDSEGVIRDCGHAMDIGRLCSQYAVDDETAWQFLQNFPYLRSMFARTTAESLAAKGKYIPALKVLDDAIAEITAFVTEHYDPVNEDGSPVEPNPFLETLQQLRKEYHENRPRTPSQRLQAEMTEALAQENYERAAQLRDQLKILENAPTTPAGKKRSGRKSSTRDANSGAA